MIPPTPVDATDFPLLQQARALWAADRLDDALVEFERAVAARPDNVRALIECARALGRRYEIGRAEALLQRAASLAASDLNVMPLIAQSYRTVHRPLRSIAVLEQLRDAGVLSPALLCELAILYEQTNQLDRSLAALHECVDRAPDQPEPRLVLARVQRVSGESLAARSLLEELTRRADASPLLRVRAWSELGYLLDEVGDHDDAVTAMEQAKQILRRSPDAQTLTLRNATINEAFDRIYAELDAPTVERWRAESPPADARCAGIAHLLGFPRSGTTLLEQLLEAHPRIAGSPERSVFSKEIFPAMLQGAGAGSLTLASVQSVSQECLDTQRRRYLDYMQSILGEPLDGRVHLDKNPNHTSLIVGLLRLFPEARFVFGVRDPRDVIVSAYLRFFPLTEFSVSLLTWEGCCRQYCFEMDVWLAVRELIADHGLQVRYEDVVNDPQAESRRVIEFLDLPWSEAVIDYRDGIQHKVVNSPSQAAVRKPIYRSAIGRWKNYRRYVEPLLERLDPYCQEFGYD